MFYLHYEAPEEEQNFPMVMEMIRAGEVREDDDAYRSPLDELFDRLEMQDPEHIALKYYRNYRSGSGKDPEIHPNHAGVSAGEVQSGIAGRHDADRRDGIEFG